MLSGNGVYIVIALVFDGLSEIVAEICRFVDMILYFETLYLGVKANLN